MEKDDILSFAKKFLAEPYTEEYLNSLSAKNPKKFFNNISKLDIKQINAILNNHSEYANKEHDGWHALHYAASLNDPFILDKFIQHALNNGLTHYPNTQKAKKDISSGMSLLNFCSAMNCEKSYAKLLTYLGNPEEQDYAHALRYAMIYNSGKMIKFLHNLIEPEILQKEILSFFCGSQRMNHGSRSNIEYVLKNNFKYNPDRFEDYGVNIKYEEPEKPNYFTLTLSVMANNYYELDELGIEKSEKIIAYFIDKGFSFDRPDGNGNIPRKIIEEFISDIDRSSGYSGRRLEKFIQELEYKSLNNELDKNNTIQPKKLKL